MTEAHRKCCATNTKIIDLSTSRLIHHDNNGRTRRSGFNKQLYNTPLLNRLEDIVSKYIYSVSSLQCTLIVMDSDYHISVLLVFLFNLNAFGYII